MPNYTYRCANCGQEIERAQSYNSKPLKKCPNCNKHALHKVYKPAGVVFKGSGYYTTDNRTTSGATNLSKNGKAEKKEAKSDAGEKGVSKKEAKTKDSKPAADKTG